MTIERNPHNPVVASARRFYTNPNGFLDGSLYENKEFRRVDHNGLSSDIDISHIDQLITGIMYTQTKHYISKPLLADTSLIDQPQVQQFFSQQLFSEIKAWMTQNPKPAIFQDRRKGFLLYLDIFHEQFGDSITHILCGLDSDAKKANTVWRRGDQ
jgi:hypothetical protein